MAPKKILVAEDNPEMCVILKTRLEEAGFSSDIVQGGYALLGYLKKEGMPDAVILDLMLPERSGVELLGTLKNKWPATKIFIFSAYPEYKDKLHLFKGHIAGFFCKTDGIDKLIGAIKEAL